MNLVPSLIKYAKFDGDIYFSGFGPRINFCGNFDPKNQTSLFNVC